MLFRSADYLMPTASDFPKIRSSIVDLKRCPNNPLGAKGGGEGGIIPVGGVMANAVADALKHLNVQPMELPLSPPRIWALVEAAKSQLGTRREVENRAASECAKSPPQTFGERDDNGER